MEIVGLQVIPEPWLRGILPGLNPVTAHLLRAAEQIREDLAHAIADLTPEELWTKPKGAASAGFHARHIAGSTSRLCTYLAGSQLSEEQMAALKSESEPGATASALLALVDHALTRYEALIRDLQPEHFADVREIGRRKLPVTAISLAIHIAEHGQRHTGQAISLAKIVCGRD